MKILIAPDKFKGALDPFETAQTMLRGIQRAAPKAKVFVLPLADGGDGTADILCRQLKAQIKKIRVTNPAFRSVTAHYGLLKHQAFLDMASSSGLALISKQDRHPMKTTSRGFGEVIHHAIGQGATDLVLGIGGSATVDGGIGALSALGIRFLDNHKREVGEGGRALSQICHLDLSGWKYPKKRLTIHILSDVKNPLLGKNGAAITFGPQKGATPIMVTQLNRGLTRLAKIIQKQTGRNVVNLQSGGAAGGIAAGFWGILGALPNVTIHLCSGIEFVLNILNGEKYVKQADWVLTAEGHLDSQTVHGKTIDGLSKLTRKYKKPLVAFAGKVSLHATQLDAMGLNSAFAIAKGPTSLEESIQNTTQWLEDATFQVGRILARS